MKRKMEETGKETLTIQQATIENDSRWIFTYSESQRRMVYDHAIRCYWNLFCESRNPQIDIHLIRYILRVRIFTEDRCTRGFMASVYKYREGIESHKLADYYSFFSLRERDLAPFRLNPKEQTTTVYQEMEGIRETLKSRKFNKILLPVYDPPIGRFKPIPILEAIREAKKANKIKCNTVGEYIGDAAEIAFDLEWQGVSTKKAIKVLQSFMKMHPLVQGLCYTNIQMHEIYPFLVQHGISKAEFRTVFIRKYRGSVDMLGPNATNTNPHFRIRISSDFADAAWNQFVIQQRMRRNKIKVVLKVVMLPELASIVDLYFEEEWSQHLPMVPGQTWANL